MRIALDVLFFLMMILSSGAIIPLFKTHGAIEEGAQIFFDASSWLDRLPSIWLSMVIILVVIGFFYKPRWAIFPKPLAVFFVYCILSIVWADSPYNAFRNLLFIVLMGLLIFNKFSTCGWRSVVRLVDAFFIFILSCSLVFIFFFPSYGVSIGEHEGKWQGAFDHKNGLGNFSALSYLFYVWSWSFIGSKRSVVGMLLSLFLVVGSQSGTAMMNILMTTLIFMLLKYSFIEKILFKRKYVIFNLVVIISVFFVYQAVFTTELYSFGGAGKDSTFSGRNVIWMHAISHIMDALISGHGVGEYSQMLYDSADIIIANTGFIWASAHNGILDITLSFGLIGLFLFYFLCLDILKRSGVSISFGLTFAYILFFLILNTTEARMASFNFNLFFLFFIYFLAYDVSEENAKIVLNGKVGASC